MCVFCFTEFQLDIKKKEVYCERAEFEYQNIEIFDSMLQKRQPPVKP